MSIMQLFFVFVAASLFKPLTLKIQDSEIRSLGTQFAKAVESVELLTELVPIEKQKLSFALELKSTIEQFQGLSAESRLKSVKVHRSDIKEMKDFLQTLQLLTNKIASQILKPLKLQEANAKYKLNEKENEIRVILGQKTVKLSEETTSKNFKVEQVRDINLQLDGTSMPVSRKSSNE